MTIIKGDQGSKITGKKENKNCPDMRDRDSFPDKRDFRESFRLLYINIMQVFGLFALRIRE
ncbi:hypothetical protein EO92_14475 [Methanosarcina sp. 2.H.A.1B.4]|nr:hypothetical protein EO92_14475 [Methanosarcina sp. 2.H.A.1B.4]